MIKRGLTPTDAKRRTPVEFDGRDGTQTGTLLYFPVSAEDRHRIPGRHRKSGAGNRVKIKTLSGAVVSLHPHQVRAITADRTPKIHPSRIGSQIFHTPGTTPTELPDPPKGAA